MKKILITISLVFLMVFSFTPRESNAFVLSQYPDAATTKTKTIDVDSYYTVKVTYPSHIFEGQDLPCRFNLYSSSGVIENLDRAYYFYADQAGAPTTGYINFYSYGQSQFDVGETTTIDFFFDVSGLLPGTYTNKAAINGFRTDWTFGDNKVQSFDEDYLSFTVVSQDSTPPVIQGSTVVFSDMENPVSLNDVENQLSATDETDGDVSSSITNIRDDYTGNEDVLGDHITEWEASDSSGNTVEITVVVRVVDVTKPVITLIGSDDIGVPYGSSWNDPGVTASDNYDGDISHLVSTTGTVNTSVLGDYTILYDVDDTSSNDAVTKSRTVSVYDSVDPVITLNGSSTIYIGYDSSFSDPGATASDNYDGNLTSSINSSGSVNTSVLGSYTRTYTVTDSSGNSDSVSRTVIVQDIEEPNISLIGDNTIFLEVGDTWSDPGATASDDYDGNVTSSIVITGVVNTTALGTYSVTYIVEDSSGNTDSTTRAVIVQDTTAPVVTLIGDSSVTIQFGNIFEEEGTSATDNLDGDVTGDVVITDNIDYSSLGTYTITYTIEDSSGNSDSITRTIIIEDLEGPVIHVTDYITYNSELTLLSDLTGIISAIDLLDGDVSGDVIKTADDYTGNETTVGTYSVTYEVTDSLGNTTTKTISIQVHDDLPPVFNPSSYLIEKSIADAMTQQEIIDHLNNRD